MEFVLEIHSIKILSITYFIACYTKLLLLLLECLGTRRDNKPLHSGFMLILGTSCLAGKKKFVFREFSNNVKHSPLY